jgi:hypothetical protein
VGELAMDSLVTPKALEVLAVDLVVRLAAELVTVSPQVAVTDSQDCHPTHKLHCRTDSPRNTERLLPKRARARLRRRTPSRRRRDDASIIPAHSAV